MVTSRGGRSPPIGGLPGTGLDAGFVCTAGLACASTPDGHTHHAVTAARKLTDRITDVIFDLMGSLQRVAPREHQPSCSCLLPCDPHRIHLAIRFPSARAQRGGSHASLYPFSPKMSLGFCLFFAWTTPRVRVRHPAVGITKLR